MTASQPLEIVLRPKDVTKGVPVEDMLKVLRATLRLLKAVDKQVNGKITTDWYLTAIRCEPDTQHPPGGESAAVSGPGEEGVCARNDRHQTRRR
jgi:hypothetical protein